MLRHCNICAMPEKMPEKMPRRARTLAEFTAALAAMAPDADELAQFSAYVPQAGDVIITPFAKCGTTLLQQMFHQLRTGAAGGDMQFDDISRVVPWIEESVGLGLDLNAPQRAMPRGFKSHLAYPDLPPGLRYIVALRDPVAAFMSFYHFMEGWFFEPGTITPEEFLPGWYNGGPNQRNYSAHLLSWWARRAEADTLLMSYDGIVAHKPAAIRAMAQFCDIALDEALLGLVEHRTSRAYMAQHADRFDDALQRIRSETHGGLPAGSQTAKVSFHADGSAREKTATPASVTQHITAMWEKDIAPVTGHADFASLAAALAI